MAFSCNLIAITWELGKHAVHSEIEGSIALRAIRELGQIRDVTQPGSVYADEAVVLSKEEVAALLPTGTLPIEQRTREWYAGLPRTVRFIMAHIEEWESGLG